jgi:hypothetical protein
LTRAHQAEACARLAAEFAAAHLTLLREDRGQKRVAGERFGLNAIEKKGDARAPSRRDGRIAARIDACRCSWA